MEYGFGAHEYPTSGVFQVEPKSCPGFIFRRSVCVGTTHMSRSQVHTSIEDLAEDYHGDTYHLIVKNCNHFTADVCKRLTGKPVPGWVNRLARLGPISLHNHQSVAPWWCRFVLNYFCLHPVGIAGSFFNCVLPDSIKVSAVRDVNAHPDFSGTLPTPGLTICAFTFTWLKFDLTESCTILASPNGLVLWSYISGCI